LLTIDTLHVRCIRKFQLYSARSFGISRMQKRSDENR
jgi:hypothetical protein